MDQSLPKAPAIARISLVAPCFNEQEVLPEFYRRASALADRLSLRGVDMDLVLVDDCSRDGTWAIMESLAAADARVRALRLARNRGHQIAITAGLDFAEGDVVVIIDADLQDPPELVEEMLDLVGRGFDVVHAQRRTRDGEAAWRLGLIRGYYWLLGRLSRIRIIENAGDFRAITRPVVLAIREFREPHRFLRGTFAAIGFRQTVMQYDRDARFAGTTKYPLRKLLKLAADGLMGFSSAPLRAIVWCSLALWALSLVYLGVSLYQKYILNDSIPGWTSVVFLMTFFTGLILMSMAVVGAYVGRIFEQGQRHPLYWLDRAINIRTPRVPQDDIPREVRLSQAILALRGEGEIGRGEREPLVVETRPGPVAPSEAEARR